MQSSRGQSKLCLIEKSGEMKPSKYNYIIQDDNDSVFFNGISETFFRVSNKNRDCCEAIIDNPDANYKDFKNFIDLIKDYGFVLNDNIDEGDVIKSKYESLRRPDLYEIMILPTYQCNLRCWYCTQEHNDQWISEDSVKKIKKRIESVLRRDEINQLHIAWFGGEPLLCYDIIKDINKWAQELCGGLNKSFVSSITTNATLLDKDKIESLRILGVNQYQITIDGDKETHDKINVLGKRSAFDISVSNIAEIAKHTQCTLRFNYTKENLKPNNIIKDIKERIPENIRKNINFFIYKVWQEASDKINHNEIIRLAHLARQIGIRPQFQTLGICYADFDNFDCVFPNGKIGKCDNANPQSKHVNGIIESNGILSWENEVNYSLYNIFDERINAHECMNCKYLPVCWGPCPMRREEMMEIHHKIICPYGSNKDNEIQKLILNQCLNLRNSIMTAQFSGE